MCLFVLIGFLTSVITCGSKQNLSYIIICTDQKDPQSESGR